MFASWSAFAVAGLALSANAAPGELFKRACNANNCYRAVNKSNQPATSTAARDAICSTFLVATVSGCVATTTSSAPAVTSTTTVTLTSGSTSTTTSVVTSNLISTVRETATTTTSIAFAKRAAVTPITGTVSQDPAACMTTTIVHSTAVPTEYAACSNSLASFSNACSCALSTLSSRTTTVGTATSTSVVTPTSVAVVVTTTTTVVTATEFSTTTLSSTSTTTLVATATVQPVSGRFFVSTNEQSTISAGDAASGFALRADMTNNAVYFNTDNMSKLKTGDLFARVISNDDTITLSATAAEAEKISCACANAAARMGSFTCRSSMGATVLQLCNGNSVHLAMNVISGCRAIIATCNPAPAAT